MRTTRKDSENLNKKIQLKKIFKNRRTKFPLINNEPEIKVSKNVDEVDNNPWLMKCSLVSKFNAHKIRQFEGNSPYQKRSGDKRANQKNLDGL